MLTALVHGNELCGAWALKDLLDAGIRPDAGSLTLAFCNLEAFDCFDAGDSDASRFVDEDMNRQWVPERLAQAQGLAFFNGLRGWLDATLDPTAPPP